MKIFGWRIEKESEYNRHWIDWFVRGYETGFRTATDEAEKEMKKHGITVIRLDPVLKEKLNLTSVNQ